MWQVDRPLPSFGVRYKMVALLWRKLYDSGLPLE